MQSLFRGFISTIEEMVKESRAGGHGERGRAKGGHWLGTEMPSAGSPTNHGNHEAFYS